MKLELLLFMGVIEWCTGIKLNPLENNDKLQDITNLYVAEWQWESWPIKQDPSGQEVRSPSQRKNVVLWKDSSGSAWYLFGGQPVNGDPKKVFSDVWKFTVKTRAWKRFFPSQAEIKGTNKNKSGKYHNIPKNYFSTKDRERQSDFVGTFEMPLLGGTLSPLVNLFDENGSSDFGQALQSIVLCGALEKSNPVEIKKLKGWSTFRRKSEVDETEDKLVSLAVYAPKTSKPDTVWRLDSISKLWTPYVCCCDSLKGKNQNVTSNSSKSTVNNNKIKPSNHTVEQSLSATGNDCSVFDSKINKVEDEVDSEQQHLKINDLRNKKKKINQIKSNDKLYYKKLKIEKRESNRMKGKANETKLPSTEEDSKENVNKTIDQINNTRVNLTNKKEDSILKVKIATEEKKQSGIFEKLNETSKHCPEYSEKGASVTWCDGRNEAIITTDINSPQITLWMFNISRTLWTQLQVKIPTPMEWPVCSNSSSIRFAGNEVNVYIFCSQNKITAVDSNKSSEYSKNSSQIPHNNFNEKLVFRINYKKRLLSNLGSIQLNPYFNSPEGKKAWENDSQAVLQVVGNAENETILVLAYLGMVDLWVLGKDHEGRESFHFVEKVWRGSALKWFNKYNAALYGLQFLAESGNSETVLLPNPRKIGVNEYWPRERGRFIIRIFRNENLKNQSFENRTREQNLTYELLQSDYKPTASENQLNHVYSLKVLVFFGISLTIFTFVGIVLFLKRCVNCPPRIRIRNECHKSPLVIRYSVIPDDFLYPVA